jgi:hypothetical protein
MFAEFLRDFIPIGILKNVRPEDIEDISERFLPLFQEARDSDTVKRINLKDGGGPLFVITIVEHESKVNHRASFKMLQYICLALDQYEKDVNRTVAALSQTKDFRYPPVLPVIFYDGPDEWTAALNFAGRTEGQDIFARYTPSFEYVLVNLNQYTLEDITRFGDTLSVIMAVGKLPRKGGSAALEKLFRDYVSTLNIPHNLRKLVTDVITVLLSKAEFPEIRITAITDVIEKKEVSGMFEGIVASIKDERRKAVRKAQKETREKTREKDAEKFHQDKLQSARKLKARGLSDEDTADILSLPVEEVTAL